MSPDLSDVEIAQICAPLVQPAAQVRYLRSLGLVVNRRPNGTPLVNRRYYETRHSPTEPVAPRVDLRPPYEGSGLQRYHREMAAAADAREVEAAIQKAEWEAGAEERAAVAKLARAALVRFHANKRRVVKLQRAAPWADDKAIRAIYRKAQRLTAKTGIPHHVDHIIPLQGKTISGLHVETNLQIITGAENSRKRNRFDPC